MLEAVWFLEVFTIMAYEKTKILGAFRVSHIFWQNTNSLFRALTKNPGARVCETKVYLGISIYR